MDTVYCLLMAIYMIAAVNSDQTGASAKRFMYFLSFIMAGFAVLHMVA